MSDHMLANGKKLADLWYGNRKKYRANAYQEISNNKDRKDRYDDLERLKRTLGNHPDLNVDDKGSENHAKRYFFNHERNFDSGYAPWTNQAHHLLPQEFWNGLTSAQMDLLKQIEYSINNGLNIIYLPAGFKAHLIHELPIHRGAHDKYSDEVITDATSVSNKLKKAEKDGGFCEKTNPPKAILERLQELQDKYWNILATTKIKKVTDLFKGSKVFSK
ncbi:MAG TPA: hypothetical protein ENK04_13115 [Gammaproteobacteria bacterium]|nr:hypothetical protein [Gammaproteobacteria bacterium]